VLDLARGRLDARTLGFEGCRAPGIRHTGRRWDVPVDQIGVVETLHAFERQIHGLDPGRLGQVLPVLRPQ
jgi:hypothetical protein